MTIKKILRALLLGGTGTLIAGLSSGRWVLAASFCMTLTFINEYIGKDKNKKR